MLQRVFPDLPSNNRPPCPTPLHSCSVAQGRAAPAGQRPALPGLHPGGPDGAHQQRVLRGEGGAVPRAGGGQQEHAQRRRQGEDGGGEEGLGPGRGAGSGCWVRGRSGVKPMETRDST